MSVEAAIFILRLLAALSLIGFLAVLFASVWRSMRQIDRQLAAARTAYGYLTLRWSDTSKPPRKAQRYRLHAITTLGRSASNTIVVNDEFASNVHARITLEDGQWWLEDRRSRNGTRLNDAPIEQRTVLADDDVIGIGNISYQLSLDAEPAS